MLIRKISISLPLSCLLLFGGCASNNAFMDNVGKVGGTAAGAGIGAVIGKQLGGDTGLIIGALLGGGIGYLIGDEIDKRRAELAKIAKEEKVEVFSNDVTTNSLASIKQNNSNKKNSIIGDSFTVISDEEQFSLGSSSLNSKSSQLFNRFAQLYKDTDKKILIIGHTDDSGDSSFNQKLSEERAKNVGKIFNNQGIKQSNIYYLGAGEMNPIANNNTSEGANKNRRVEIVELNDLNDIAIYSSKTSTPEYFRKITPKIKPINTIIEKKRITKKPSSVIIKEEIATKAIDTAITIKNDMLVIKDKIETKIEKNFIDFNGQKVANNSFALKENFGNSNQDKGFSILNKAYANNDTNIYLNCMYDKPRNIGKAKSLETNKDINYSTTEFKRGLNEVPWIAEVNNHLIGINPIGILSNGSKVTKNPEVTVYKDYSANSGKKADLRITTSVNTYQGTDGLIYRIFLDDKSNQLECMDIVFNEKNISDSNGIVYYSKNNQTYEKSFKIKQLTKR